MKRILSALLVLLWTTVAYGQASVLQGGSWTEGLVPMYSSSGGSQPIVRQSAGAGGGTQSIKEFSIVKRGTGSAPYVGGGGGYLGATNCSYDGPTTGPYHQLCLEPNATGGFGMLSYNAFNGASVQDLKFVINGASYVFPFSDGFVVGPGSSTVGHIATWANTAGTLLADGGPAPTPGGSSGQVQYNNAGAFGGFTVGGDATLNTGTGSLTVSKIGGISVSLGGTLSTASSFATSGAFPLTLTATASTSVTLPITGTLATLAGAEALTNKTYNGNTWTAGTGVLTIGPGKTLTVSNIITFTATDGSTLAIGAGGTLGTAAYTATTAYVPSNTQIIASLGADVNLNDIGLYFDGPSVAQGSTGTWFASGTVTLFDSAGAANFNCKLWDGTTVIASASGEVPSNVRPTSITLSGRLASPAGNIRISCQDLTSTNGTIQFNFSGNSKDSTLTVFRTN